MSLGDQLIWLVLLSLPVACVAWTVTHEQVFAEPREWFERKSRTAPSLVQRKFFYLFTCEYCFSHYVAAAVVWSLDFRLLADDWRGAVVAWLAVVWIANVYMSLFVRLRLDIKRERVEVDAEQRHIRSAAHPRRAR